MKNNWVKIILVLVILILFGLLIWKSSTQVEKPYKIIALDSTNSVSNNTLFPYYDTAVKVGLNLLDIHNVTIHLYPLTKEMISLLGPDIELSAHIKKINEEYVIWIDNEDRNSVIDIIAHELIHLKQFHSSELIIKNNVLTWKGDVYDANSIEYSGRPWEIDAVAKGKILEKEIRTNLY